MLEATRIRALLPVQNAHSLEESIDLIRNRAMAKPKGRWIQTSNGWHEQKGVSQPPWKSTKPLRITPCCIRRGIQMAVANSLALKRAASPKRGPLFPAYALAAQL
jgi:predicted amidohydrolase YtcJ